MRDPITIITTVRDGDLFLGRYFDNLTGILGPNDHAVIVDDGSRIALVIPENWHGDRRLLCLYPGKIGRGAALNLAIENSPTDLIAIQDIDDISLPGRLDRQVAMLSDSPDRLVFASSLSDPVRLSWPRAHSISPSRISPSRLYVSNPLHHSALAMHRSVWARAGGYATDLPCCIDLDFYLRACVHAKADIYRLQEHLIDRNHDPANRHFAQIPDRLYRQTRNSVLTRYCNDLPCSAWQIIAKLRMPTLFSRRKA